MFPELGLIDEDMERIKRLSHHKETPDMNFGVELVRISGIGREDMRREGKWRGVIASLLGNLETSAWCKTYLGILVPFTSLSRINMSSIGLTCAMSAT